MAPSKSAGADAAVTGQREVVTDPVAGRLARLRGVDQTAAGPNQQRLDRGDADLQRLRHLVIGAPLQLAHQQRRALLRRQPTDVDDQPTQILSPLGLRRRIRCRRA
jgi:hypothetical protein